MPKVATSTAEGLWGAVWLPGVVTYLPPTIGQIVAAKVGDVNQWLLASKLTPTDAVWTDSPSPADPSTQWWPVSALSFAVPVVPTNPQYFTISHPLIAQEIITGFNVKFGRVSGTYTLTAKVPPEDIFAASGMATGKIADLHQTLAAGTWYAVATAINAVGESAASPEMTFSVTLPPSTYLCSIVCWLRKLGSLPPNCDLCKRCGCP